MECLACKSKQFFKHSSGFLVCENCFTQAKAPELKSEDFSTTPVHLKRKLKISIKKSKKEFTECKPYLVLTWEQYLQNYKDLLSYCIQTLISKLKLKKEVFKIALAVFEFYIPDVKSEFVLPKNRRKRKGENPSKYPKNKLNFLETIRKVYNIDSSDKGLYKICKELGIASASITEFDRAKCTLSLYAKINPEVKLINSEVPIELSLILVIAYISMIYSYSETRAIFVGDVLEWAYSGVLPYFTGYLHLSLPKSYISLFKPISLPSASWLSSTVKQSKIDCVHSFRVYFPFIHHLSLHICESIGLPKLIAELTTKLYLRTTKATVCKINENALPVLNK
jgi:hypothetical protein